MVAVGSIFREDVRLDLMAHGDVELYVDGME